MFTAAGVMIQQGRIGDYGDVFSVAHGSMKAGPQAVACPRLPGIA
jgi:hypothetical protein